MAGNLNKVFLIGNLTRDPELRYTPQGHAISKFAIAVNRAYKGHDGELKKETHFFNIVVWGKTGENCSKFLSKGRSVLVEGRLQNRSYETQDKQKRTVTEIVADNVQFLGSAGDRLAGGTVVPSGSDTMPSGSGSQGSGNQTIDGGDDFAGTYGNAEYSGGPDDGDVPF